MENQVQKRVNIYIMNASTAQSQSNFSIFLLGAILNILAGLDYTSLMDYTAKAIIGGIVWLVFKVIADFVKERFIVKEKKGEEE